MPLSNEDQMEIMQLMARYNHAADASDSEGFANTFTDDALFEGSAMTARGREELLRVVGGPPSGTSSRHWNNNILIEGDGDDATAKVYLMRVALTSPPHVMASGVYHDTLKRIDGEWKFTHRKVHPDQISN